MISLSKCVPETVPGGPLLSNTLEQGRQTVLLKSHLEILDFAGREAKLRIFYGYLYDKR